jgi:uncharacterized membrane protein YraQ (UPF0718 family)
MAGALVLLLELVIIFFALAFLVEIFQRRIGDERLRAWMGGRPVLAALKGIAIGFVTPFCTYSPIPMLVGLRRARVPTAGSVAFIVAVPVLDPVLFGAPLIIVGIEAHLKPLEVPSRVGVAPAGGAIDETGCDSVPTWE